MADPVVVGVFIGVYAGMILGEIPGLALDRSGIALLGAIALIASERISPEQAWRAIDVPTVALLFGLMVVSAQFRLGGFYTEVVRRIGAKRSSPEAMLAVVVGSAGVLSALLVNDIVCFAMAPVLVAACQHQRLNPVPFLLGLAAASNVGSAMTLIGNPQNMLIGQTLRLSFPWYLREAFLPSVAGLSLAWWILRLQWRGRWQAEPREGGAGGYERRQLPGRRKSDEARDMPPFTPWQSTKGIVVLLAAVCLFILSPWPREVVALTAAGVLLLSRRMASYEMLGLVDWHLLVLFAGLFVVHDVTARAGMLDAAFSVLRGSGIDLAHPAWLFAIAPLLCNLVSNVPAVMLLLPVAHAPLDGLTLALASTLSGNLLIVGSIANIIVVDQAARAGVRIDWRTHARSGIPITLATLALAAAWVAIRS